MRVESKPKFEHKDSYAKDWIVDSCAHLVSRMKTRPINWLNCTDLTQEIGMEILQTQ